MILGLIGWALGIDPSLLISGVDQMNRGAPYEQQQQGPRGETGKPTSHLTRSRSMIRHGEGRYMDPEGGFFTFGLTNRTAIILVEFEGNPQAPCVEKEIRLCLTPPAREPPKGTATRDKLPAYACTQAGALTL